MPENKREDRPKSIRALVSPQAGLSRQTRRARRIFPGNALESLENMRYFLRFLPVPEKICTRRMDDIYGSMT